MFVSVAAAVDDALFVTFIFKTREQRRGTDGPSSKINKALEKVQLKRVNAMIKNKTKRKNKKKTCWRCDAVIILLLLLISFIFVAFLFLLILKGDSKSSTDGGNAVDFGRSGGK